MNSVRIAGAAVPLASLALALAACAARVPQAALRKVSTPGGTAP
jgi:hypothetical protein